ncbi:MAG: hypothetical protein S4CHLAM123_01080 [Chlamydiales bacterium]|nr:hypothetical protein [Chlamydiales bacterium]
MSSSVQNDGFQAKFLDLVPEKVKSCVSCKVASETLTAIVAAIVLALGVLFIANGAMLAGVVFTAVGCAGLGFSAHYLLDLLTDYLDKRREKELELNRS